MDDLTREIVEEFDYDRGTDLEVSVPEGSLRIGTYTPAWQTETRFKCELTLTRGEISEFHKGRTVIYRTSGAETAGAMVAQYERMIERSLESIRREKQWRSSK